MDESEEYYQDLIEKGYEVEHALLCTIEKFPDFVLQTEPVSQDFEQGEGTVAKNHSPYRPYMPVLHQEETTVNQFKDTTSMFLDSIKERVKNSNLQEVQVSKKTLVIAGSIVGLFLVSTVLILLANDAGGPIEGKWMNNQGQRFVFSDDATAQFRTSSDTMWSSDGSTLTLVASNSGKTFTHKFQFSVSDNGKALWMMPESITDETGNDYFDMPGYAPSCMLLLKSDTAPTLIEYIEKAPGYDDDTPNWCLLK